MQASGQLSAWLDGELDESTSARIEHHLAACGACRAAADALRGEDAEMRRAFAARRQAAASLAARVTDQLRAERPTIAQATFAESTARGAWAGWGPVLTAAAAGFLLAFLLFRPGKPTAPVATPAEGTDAVEGADAVEHVAEETVASRPIARLALATGDVELRPAQIDAWAACSSTSAIEPGTTVRTGPQAQCEVPTLVCPADVRLDVETEVQFVDAARIQLARGQLWTCVHDGPQPLEVRADDATVTARDATFEVSAAEGQTRVTVLQGSADVADKRESRTVQAGQRVTIAAGQMAATERLRDTLLGFGWMDALLTAKGPNNPELANRLDGLLARLGNAKLSYLYEEEIRRLGDVGVPPLVHYLEASAGQPHEPRRAIAARIVADVAQPRWIPNLVGLLADDDPEVRFHSAAGLKRLTGYDQGRTAEQWRDAPSEQSLAALRAWEDWWRLNQDHYPGAQRRDILTKERPPEPAVRGKG